MDFKPFQAGCKELKEVFPILASPNKSQFFANKGITRKFIAPRAAWWGGWWERMVGKTKRCLRKVLGQIQVDEEMLNTILSEIQAVINSRPLL
jgi:hypothetical protein